MNTERFVSVGEKKNGKIVKNEMYNIYDFVHMITKYKFEIEKTDLTFWERLSKKKVDEYFYNEVDRYLEYYYLNILSNIETLIEKDNKGRKVK